MLAAVSEDAAADNVARQVQLYGAPLAQVIDQITGRLGLTQGRVAQILGLSAPMMSHLVSARRVKMGNPVAHTRLIRLRQLAEDVAAGGIPASGVASELEAIAADNDTWAGTTTTHLIDDDAAIARRVQELFRHVADAADWLEVAATVEERHPQIAELLRVYGAGRTGSAEQHWTQTLGD